MRPSGRALAAGERPRSSQELGIWDAEGLPGKRGFDLAHDALRSGVEALVADFTTMDVGELGRFDVVLFLGVLSITCATHSVR